MGGTWRKTEIRQNTEALRGGTRGGTRGDAKRLVFPLNHAIQKETFYACLLESSLGLEQRAGNGRGHGDINPRSTEKNQKPRHTKKKTRTNPSMPRMPSIRVTRHTRRRGRRGHRAAYRTPPPPRRCARGSRTSLPPPSAGGITPPTDSM